MSKYTTGEIAKLCGVSVRTVQYYDNRNILVPTALSEGGRRLYSEADLKRMRIICFLREMGFSLDHIGELFSDTQPEKVISLLIEQQEQALHKELQENQTRLDKLTDLKRSLKDVENFTVDSLGDIAHIMKNQKKRRRLMFWITVLGLLMDIIEVGTVVYGIRTGIWWPLMAGLPVVIALGVFISYYYFYHVEYICPECHACFRPRFSSVFWAAHTPNTRRLTCPRCGHKGFCVETYAERSNKRRASSDISP